MTDSLLDQITVLNSKEEVGLGITYQDITAAAVAFGLGYYYMTNFGFADATIATFGLAFKTGAVFLGGYMFTRLALDTVLSK